MIKHNCRYTFKYLKIPSIRFVLELLSEWMDEYLLKHRSIKSITDLRMSVVLLRWSVSPCNVIPFAGTLYLPKGSLKSVNTQPICSIFLELLTNVALLSNPSSKRIRTASNPCCNVKFNWKIFLSTVRTKIQVAMHFCQFQKKWEGKTYLFPFLFSERAKNKCYRIHFPRRPSNAYIINNQMTIIFTNLQMNVI